jgi:hypothetical protein
MLALTFRLLTRRRHHGRFSRSVLKFDLRTSCKPRYGNSLQTAALLAKKNVAHDALTLANGKVRNVLARVGWIDVAESYRPHSQ